MLLQVSQSLLSEASQVPSAGGLSFLYLPSLALPHASLSRQRPALLERKCSEPEMTLGAHTALFYCLYG